MDKIEIIFRKLFPVRCKQCGELIRWGEMFGESDIIDTVVDNIFDKLCSICIYQRNKNRSW